MKKGTRLKQSYPLLYVIRVPLTMFTTCNGFRLVNKALKSPQNYIYTAQMAELTQKIIEIRGQGSHGYGYPP